MGVDSENYLYQYVIYDNPSDWPGSFVVRRWRIGKGTVEAEKLPQAVVSTLESARRCIPEGMVNIGRQPDDDPAIAEVWT